MQPTKNQYKTQAAKIENLDELSKLMSSPNTLTGDLLSLFGRFGLGHLLRRFSLEEQCGVPTVQLILSLCLFRVKGDSIHSMYNKRFHDLLSTGKNCYYRLLNRSAMDWRRLHLGMVSRFFAVLRKEGAEESKQPCCYIPDDTTPEKTGLRIECLSRVYDHVRGASVLGYKLLLMAFFDGRTTIPADFSLHREMDKTGKGGLTHKQLKARYRKKRNKDNPGSLRLRESDSSKVESAIEMMKRAWKAGLRAQYALTDSRFTGEHLIESVRKTGKGCVHFVGLAKMSNTRYSVHGRKHNAHELVSLYERERSHSCRKYKCRYISLKGTYAGLPIRIFLIRYGRNQKWNILLTTDMSLDFVKCFELYQIRWNIEVMIKECKGHLGLGSYRGRDFDGQIADCTLCMLTYIVVCLDKRFSEYETMGAPFAERRDEWMALTLWHRILGCISRILEIPANLLGQTPEELLEMMLQGQKAAEEYKVMLGALEMHYAEKEHAA